MLIEENVSIFKIRSDYHWRVGLEVISSFFFSLILLEYSTMNVYDPCNQIKGNPFILKYRLGLDQSDAEKLGNSFSSLGSHPFLTVSLPTLFCSSKALVSNPFPTLSTLLCA